MVSHHAMVSHRARCVHHAMVSPRARGVRHAMVSHRALVSHHARVVHRALVSHYALAVHRVLAVRHARISHLSRDVRHALVVHRRVLDVHALAEHHYALVGPHSAHRVSRDHLRSASTSYPDACLWASVSLGHDRTAGTTQCNREFVRTRQFLEVAQRKLLEEQRCRAVQQRTSDSFCTTNNVDQSAFVQRLEHTANGHAANFLDFGTPDRLTIRNDRECFQRRRGQTLRTHGNLCTLDCFCIFSARKDLPTAGLFDEFDSMTIDIVVLAQFVERCSHGRWRRLRIE
jgi:hypothetical protein